MVKKHEEKQLSAQVVGGVDRHRPFVHAHICQSFIQVKGDVEGVCKKFLLCTPIKKALKNELLIEPNLGHVVCPHASTNLAKIIYGEFDEETLKMNYKECFD